MNPRKRSRARRRSGGGGMSLGSGFMGLLKNAGVMGGGAVAVDLAMGQVGKFFPSAASPINADGSTNWLYFAAKTGLAVGVARYGNRFLPGGWGVKMGEGALAVLAYQIIRGFVPSSLALGAYFNPAPTMRPTLSGSAARGASLAGSAASGSSLAGMAAYADSGEAAAARAANIVALSRRRG